jgi:hypothetical protein
MLARVVVTIFDGQSKPQHDLFFTLVQRLGRNGDFMSKSYGLVVQFSDGYPELDQIPEPNRQFRRLRTLWQKIRRSGFQRLDSHVLVLNRSHHDNRDVGVSRKRPKFADKGDAVQLGHLVIDEDDIELFLASDRQGLERVEAGGGLNRSVRFDEVLEQPEYRAAVVDE